MNRLMVRHFVDTRLTKELILLDTRESVYSPDSFEQAIEIVASVARAAELAGRQAFLVLPGQAEDGVLGSSAGTLDRLTLAHMSRVLSVEDMFRSTPRGGDISGIVVVTGDTDASDLVARARAKGQGKTVIVVRCRPKVERTAMAFLGDSVVLDTPSAEALIAIWAQAVTRV